MYNFVLTYIKEKNKVLIKKYIRNLLRNRKKLTETVTKQYVELPWN